MEQLLEAPTGSFSEVETVNFAEFADELSRSFLPLTTTRKTAGDFWSRMSIARVGDSVVSEISASEHAVTREKPDELDDSTRSLKVECLLRGTGTLVQDDREAHLKPGSIVIYDTSRPYCLEHAEEMRTLVLMVKMRRLDITASMLRSITAVDLSCAGGVSDIVSSYLQSFSGRLSLLNRRSGRRVIDSMVDCVSGLLSDHLGVAHAAVDAHAALLQAVYDYIEAHLDDPCLTLPQIAAAHFVSVRHLHAVFDRDGVTIAAWIRDRRLQRCHNDLTDPQLAQLPVSAIASRWCFSDQAHFTKLFKSTYGVTPGLLHRIAFAPS